MGSDLRDSGTDPDPRFSLANERTFLAWNRTSLALVGGGLAAGQLVDFSSEVERLVVSLLPIALGAALALLGYHRWRENERAMRLGLPLATEGPLRLLTAGLTVVAVAVAVAVIAGGRH